MNASNYKVITILMGGEVKESRDLISEDHDALLAEIKAVNNNNFAVVYKRNVRDFISATRPPRLNIFLRSRLMMKFISSVSLVIASSDWHLTL